jgi:uncharacterized protein (PEP-CTERM system associated)
MPPGQRDLTAVPLAEARAGKWNFTARASADFVLTDNVALAPPGQEEADMILGLSLPLGVRRASPRLKFMLDYIPTVYLYARNRDSDYLQNNLRSFLSLEAVDDFFFIDAIANSFPAYVDPFVPRPLSGAFVTQNRTQQTTLGLSPYIRHETARGWTYLLRNDNLWNVYSDSQLAESFASRLAAIIESAPTRVNYGFDYTYLYTRNQAQPTAFYEQVGRFRPGVLATRRTNVSARLGYENNDYVTPQYSGAVYGAGIDWVPNPRTRLDGFLEHRFFGPSYALNFNYRTRKTVWRLRGTRNLTTTAEQSLTQRPATTAELLDEAFRARVPDPEQREQEVRQFLNNAGLSSALTQPYSFYTDQVYLSKLWTGSVAMLGRRDTLELAFFWQDNEPIPAPANASLAFAGVQPFRQQSLTLRFSHRLSAFTSLTLTGNRLYSQPTSADAAANASQESIEDTVRLGLTHRLGERTDATIGLQWSNFDSVTNPYQEVSVIGGVAHTF